MSSLWINQGGLLVQDAQMMSSAHNLTNMGTFAYKKGRVLVADQFYTTLKQAGAMADQNNELPSGLQVGTGARVVGTQKVFTPGNIQNTSNPLDLAILGMGFLQVQRPNGEIAYTRNGQLQLNAGGEMVTVNGLPLEPVIAIPQERQEITISSDGRVFVGLPGEAQPQEVGQLMLVNFINPSGLKALGDHLYLETAASGEAIESPPGEEGAGEIRQYALEASNVDMVEELVNFIMIQRGYEMQSKAIKIKNDSEENLVRNS